MPGEEQGALEREEVEMFYILFWVVVTQMYTIVKYLLNSLLHIDYISIKNNSSFI